MRSPVAEETTTAPFHSKTTKAGGHTDDDEAKTDPGDQENVVSRNTDPRESETILMEIHHSEDDLREGLSGGSSSERGRRGRRERPWGTAAGTTTTSTTSGGTSDDEPKDKGEWRTDVLYVVGGVAVSWIVVDGMFAQIATFDRTQPEGLALATYLNAVAATANTIVVPWFEWAREKTQWPLERWVVVLAWTQVGSCLLAAATWYVHVGGLSVSLYVVMFLSSMSGNGQQLALLPWLAESGETARIAMTMAGGSSGVLFTALFAFIQSAVGGAGGPSLFFAVLACVVAVSALALHAVGARKRQQQSLKNDASSSGPVIPGNATTTALSTTDDDDDVERQQKVHSREDDDDAASTNPMRAAAADGPTGRADDAALSTPPKPEKKIETDDDADDAPLDKRSDDRTHRTLRLCCAPFLDFGGRHERSKVKRTDDDDDEEERERGSEKWRGTVNAIAWSNAYMQLVSWVFVRSAMPYAFKAIRPRSAGRDGGSYLTAAVTGSLVCAFLGALVAFATNANADLTFFNVSISLCFGGFGLALLSTDPPLSSNAPALLLVLAACYVRGADGFCSPTWYRRVAELSGDPDLVKQAGALAICVVMIGVWILFILVLTLLGSGD